MAVVVQTLLFGLAPIFICCMLFEAYQAFIPGLDQPAGQYHAATHMIFAFYSFFAGLIQTAMLNTMPPNTAPVC